MAHATHYNWEYQFSFCTRNTADKSNSQIGLNRDQQAVSFHVWRICRRPEFQSSAKRLYSIQWRVFGMRNPTKCLRNSIHCLRSHFSLTLVFAVLTAQATWLMQRPQKTPIRKKRMASFVYFRCGHKALWHASSALASMRPCDVAARAKRHDAVTRRTAAYICVFFFRNSCRRGV